MKLERQPSNLIDSFAQTENRLENLMTEGSTSSDMVDSGVGSQHKPSTKEASSSNPMDEDEDISLKETGDDDDKKDDEVSEEIECF